MKQDAETLVRALNAHEGDYQKQIEIADAALRAGAEALATEKGQCVYCRGPFGACECSREPRRAGAVALGISEEELAGRAEALAPSPKKEAWYRKQAVAEEGQCVEAGIAEVAEALAPSIQKGEDASTRSETPEISQPFQSSAPTAGGVTTPAPNHVQYRIWVTPMLFKKNGFPSIGTFGASENNVVIMTTATWKNVKGEFYPCKPDIFAATYEAVSVSAAPPPSALRKYRIIQGQTGPFLESHDGGDVQPCYLPVYLAADVDARLAIAEADWTRVSDELDQTVAINDTLRAEVVRLTRALADGHLR